MSAYLLGVVVEQQVSLIVVGCLHRVEVGGQRRLRVDDHRFVAGEPNNQVRPEPTVVRLDSLLLEEIAVLDHARELDHALELHFAPLTPDLRGAQRAYKCLRLSSELLLDGAHQPKVLVESRVARNPLSVDRVQRLIDSRQSLVDRSYHVIQRFIADLEVCLRNSEERFIIRFEGLGAERLESVPHACFRALDHREFLRRSSTLRLKRRAESLALAVADLQLRAELIYSARPTHKVISEPDKLAVSFLKSRRGGNAS